MATKEKAKADKAAATVEQSLDDRQSERFLSERNGVNIAPADHEVLSGDIDSRMAALLKDHQAMGARPK